MSAAAAEGGVKPLQNAMKMAKNAIQLDGESRSKEAYCEYLRTINYISHVLLEQAESQKEKEATGVELERMLRLGEQCLERAKSFIQSDSASQEPSTLSPCSPAPPESSQTTATADTVCPASVSLTTTGRCPVMSEGGGEQPSSFLPPEVFQKLQTHESCDRSKKELTPIEQASRLNQKLKANYEARLARLTPGQANQKTSLKLSLQRQMMENLIIARARQDALQRKMEERRLRLQEEANRRFAASGAMTVEEQEQRRLYTNVLEYEQDHDWPKLWKTSMKEYPDDVTLAPRLVSYLLSRSDHPVVKLLRKHQYSVYNRLYPIISSAAAHSPAPQPTPSHSDHSLLQTGQSTAVSSSPSPSRHNLHTSGEDEEEEEEPHTQALVEREHSFEDLEQFLTNLDWTPPEGSRIDDLCSDSNLTFDPAVLKECQVQELEMRALKEHLKAVVKDIHIAIDQLLSLALLSFECLNTAASKDLCLACIEEAFFTPLWTALVALFRKVNVEREQAFQSSMTLYREASPRDVGVSIKLFPPEPGTLQGSYPYECAVLELKLLLNDYCPQKKLECLIRTLRMICACAEDYRSLHDGDASPTTAAIGADDLLPILSFVALRSQCPQLVSECAALEEFIHEGYLIGEEGYCLTSLQSSLAYVESLHAAGAQLPPDTLL
ncbi:VPS9 domain-containing protein 1 isoform X2 [Cynoglossus semilaevis]|uniref:VPS9 domain-containing protein 1 isoform X2 n=1 Tax=Cynoglossus semilaevis TaxID=244447 RepID=UPI000D62F00E|nr:VPS9 domain-containing protein 1 isoform X2 [Cynoglossus semilaevis]